MQTELTALRKELEQEAEPTRRLLERVPRDRLQWKPHPRSMSLGELALHVARIPGDFARILEPSGVDFAEVSFEGPAPTPDVHLSQELGNSLQVAGRWLATLDDQEADALWSARSGEKVLFAVPRITLVRSLIFNHWYHHRGQLCVYLRLLGVPVPPLYGPSADENPFS